MHRLPEPMYNEVEKAEVTKACERLGVHIGPWIRDTVLKAAAKINTKKR